MMIIVIKFSAYWFLYIIEPYTLVLRKYNVYLRQEFSLEMITICGNARKR